MYLVGSITLLEYTTNFNSAVIFNLHSKGPAEHIGPGPYFTLTRLCMLVCTHILSEPNYSKMFKICRKVFEILRSRTRIVN